MSDEQEERMEESPVLSRDESEDEMEVEIEQDEPQDEEEDGEGDDDSDDSSLEEGDYQAGEDAPSQQQGRKKTQLPQRQSSGRATRPPARTRDYEDVDTSFEGEGADDSVIMDGATAAAQAYFSTQLILFMAKHHPGDSATEFKLSDWRIEISNQRRGLSAGHINVTYHRLSPSRKCRSRVEVAMELGIFPMVRVSKLMSRPLQFMSAQETRERALISQQINAHGDPDTIEEFLLDPEPPHLIFAKPCPEQAAPKVFSYHCFPLVPNSRIRSDDEREAEKESREICAAEDNSLLNRTSLPAIKEFGASYGYSYGNTCIINFGRIVPTGHFHNRDHLYPLGLKFVRQEHDTVTNRVVDCVCEIDCIRQSNPLVNPLQNMSFDELDDETKSDLRPLFRVTVAWEVGYNKCAIRVYEGKTPQLVWQSVLLERLGNASHEESERVKLLENDMLDSLTKIHTDDDICLLSRTPPPLESMDEEERKLRAEMVELRRLHMRALSAGQEKGEVQAVEPRLALSHVDEFFDIGLLPLFEGMDGSEDCVGYLYIDSRNKELPRTVLLKHLSSMQTKMRGLDRIASNFASERVSVLLNIKKAQKREAAEMTKQQKIDEKKKKFERSQFIVERRNRVRDLEKSARTLRDDTIRALNGRRHQSKFRVELLAKDEELLPEVNEALEAAMREEERQYEEQDKIALEEAEESDEENNDEEQEEEVEAEDGKSIPRFSKKPKDHASSLQLPFGIPVSLPADTFGKAMELWQFLVTYGSVLGIIAVPSEKHFETALSICDPGTLHLQGIISRAQSQVLGPTKGHEKDDDDDNDDEYNGDLCDHPSRVKSRLEAKDMLTKLAVVLCKPLMAEYHRLMLVEASEPMLGNLGMELNEVTWKEIARVVLTSTICNHCGLNDQEVMSSYRGRGHLTAPDIYDRRVLRLAKRRIWFKYNQYIYRNQPDTAPIVTPQNKKSMNHNLYRRHILMNNYVGLGADFTSGMVLRLTAPSVFEDDDIAMHPVVTGMSNSSGDSDLDSSTPSLHPQLVKFWCQLYSHLCIFCKDAPFANTWMVLELTFRLLEMAIQHSRHNGAHRYAWHVLKICRVPESASCGHLFPEAVHGVLCLTLRRLIETSTHGVDQNMKSLVQDILDNSQNNPSRINATPIKPSSSDGSGEFTRVGVDVTNKKQLVYERISPLQMYWKRKSAAENLCAPISETYTSPSEIHEDGVNDNMDVSEPAELEKVQHAYPESDASLSSLTVASQRMYRTLSHLMQSPQAANFNVAVDGELVKGYYSFIRNPLCLHDIQIHLLAGGYEGKLAAFYKDVSLVFHNALAFNEESTAIAQAALKLQFVFDRLVYECLLSLDNTLENLENCHICASSYDGDEGTTVICDRCDGLYHITCLSPPLLAPPRGEWFCPNCVSERDVELVHPLRHSIVHDPLDETGQTYFGRVVGIIPRERSCRSHCLQAEAMSATETYLEYHIEFGFEAEDLALLEGAMKYSIDPVIKTLDVIGRGHQKTSVWLLEDVLQHRFTPMCSLNQSNDTPHTSTSEVGLPEGYSYEVYDQLAAISSCHHDWGLCNSTLPACIDPAFSLKTDIIEREGITSDNSDRLRMVLRGAAVLGPCTAHLDFQSEDWITVLLALVYKAVSVDNSFIEKGQLTEKDIEGRYMDIVRDLKEDRDYPSLLEYQRKPDTVAIGRQLLVVGEEKFLDEVEQDSGEESEEESDDEEGGSEDDESEEDESEDNESIDSEGGKGKQNKDEEERESSSEEGWSADEDSKLLNITVEKQQAKNARHGSGEEVDSSTNGSSVVSIDTGDQEEKEEKEIVDKSEEAECKSDIENEDEDDSSDDDLWDEDMEIAAQSGKQLPKPTLEPKKFTIFSWETERRHRRKGIEDALLTISVVHKLSQKILDDDMLHDDSEESASALNQLFSPVIKQCLPRQISLEDIDLRIWTPAYERRLLSAMRQQLAQCDKCVTYPEKCPLAAGDMKAEISEAVVKDEYVPEEMHNTTVGNTTSTSSRFCAWCAQAEDFTCSQFVHGHTWSEWFDWKQARDDRSRARKEAQDKASANELDRILSGQSNLPTDTEEGKYVPSTVVQVWLPVNKDDAALVLQEAARSKQAPDQQASVPVSTTLEPPTLEDENTCSDKVLLYPPSKVEIEVLKGSVVVHESCAEAMNALRMQKFSSKLAAFQKTYHEQRRFMSMKAAKGKKRSSLQSRLEAALQLALTRKEGQYPEERMLADVLVGVGQGKVVSLGYDFSGNVYYALSGSMSLLVCSKSHPDYDSCENPYIEDSPPFSMVSMPDPLSLLHSSHQVDVASRKFESETGLQWRVFQNSSDIAAIITQLSQNVAPERSLRSALQILYLREFHTAPVGNVIRNPPLTNLLSDDENFQLLLAGEDFSVQDDNSMYTSSQSREELNCDKSTSLGKRKARDTVRDNAESMKKLRCLAGDWHSPFLSALTKHSFPVGARVLCDGNDCLGNALLWDAKVMDVRLKGRKRNKTNNSEFVNSLAQQNMYKVRFLGWGPEYDSWLPEDELRPLTGPSRNHQNALRRRASTFSYSLPNGIGKSARSQPSVPQILSTLCAYTYISAPNRHNHRIAPRASGLSATFNPANILATPLMSNTHRRPSNFASDNDSEHVRGRDRAATVETVNVSEGLSDEMAIVKSAMLFVQAALPLGAVDDAEDRWGRGHEPIPYLDSMMLPDSGPEGLSFFNAWRHAVINASKPCHLMECQIMLEYGIRTAWLRTAGAKLMTCLPSRCLSIRQATLGLVAVRLWALDKAVRYDKVKKSSIEGGGFQEDEVELRKDKESKLRAKQASKKKQLMREESTRKRAQYR